MRVIGAGPGSKSGQLPPKPPGQRNQAETPRRGHQNPWALRAQCLNGEEILESIGHVRWAAERLSLVVS